MVATYRRVSMAVSSLRAYGRRSGVIMPAPRDRHGRMARQEAIFSASVTKTGRVVMVVFASGCGFCRGVCMSF